MLSDTFRPNTIGTPTPVIPNITKEEGNFQIDIDIMMCLYLYTTC